MDREEQTSSLPQEFREKVWPRDLKALLKSTPKPRKKSEIEYLVLPKEKFDPKSGEDIFVFLKRTWAPLYLRGEDITIHTLRRLDPQAYAAIPWPKTTYSAEWNAGRAKSLVEYLRNHWKKHIDLGFVTRSVIRKHDPRAYGILIRREAPLPKDVRILSVSDHINIQIKFAVEANRPFSGRLAQARSRIRRGERRFLVR